MGDFAVFAVLCERVVVEEGGYRGVVEWRRMSANWIREWSQREAFGLEFVDAC